MIPNNKLEANMSGKNMSYNLRPLIITLSLAHIEGSFCSPRKPAMEALCSVLLLLALSAQTGHCQFGSFLESLTGSGKPSSNPSSSSAAVGLGGFKLVPAFSDGPATTESSGLQLVPAFANSAANMALNALDKLVNDRAIIDSVSKEFGNMVDGWSAAIGMFAEWTLQARKDICGFIEAALPGLSRKTEKEVRQDITVAKANNQVLPKAPTVSKQASQTGTSGRPLVIPETFDARKAFPQCAERIGDIRHQGRCGSCWANAAASVLSDRFCVLKGIDVKLSVQDLLNCMPADYIPKHQNKNLCNGLDTAIAMRMLVTEGAVTGDEFARNNTGCKPYSSKPYLNKTAELTCPKTCSNPAFKGTYLGDKWKGVNATVFGVKVGKEGPTNSYTMDENGLRVHLNTGGKSVETLIQEEIMTKGSVGSAMDIYTDYYSYKKGVYRKSSGKENDFAGSHAVKIIGWGVVRPTKYWLIVNSWSTKWGQDGLFLLPRGQNYLNIENKVVTVDV